MANILIAFYSRGGTTEKLAAAVAEGASSAGATVRLRRAREVVPPDVMALVPGWHDGAKAMNDKYEAPTADDAVWADGIVFGTPTRFGGACSELRAYIDSLGGLWANGALNGKVGAAFSATASIHGGNETTILSLYPTLAHLGLIIVPTGYTDPAMFSAGTPYGATAVCPIQAPVDPSATELAAAHYQGRRVALVADRLIAST